MTMCKSQSSTDTCSAVEKPRQSLPESAIYYHDPLVLALIELYLAPDLGGQVLRVLTYYTSHPLTPPRPEDLTLLLALSIAAQRAGIKT
jgi:hypothetical protein